MNYYNQIKNELLNNEVLKRLKINQDKTIGIILVRKDNKYIVKYSSDERILSREYILV